ncbi:RNA polymerase sigma factor [Paenibacillus sp. CMAA1364]
MSNHLKLLVATDFNHLDQSLQEKVYYEYYDLVYGLVYYMLKNHTATEDIIQDAFILVIRKKPIFENEIKLRAWLKVVCRNATITYLRKNKKHRNQMDIDYVNTYIDEGLQSSISVEQEVEFKMMEDSLQALVNTLKPEYRVLIEYRWKQGLSYKEISDILEIKEEVIKQRLFRARENIRKKLRNEWGEIDEQRKI